MLHSRDKRVGEKVRQALAHIFQHEIKDPRVPQFVTITDVHMSRDLRNAKVYYSQIPDDEDSLEAMKDFLEASVGHLRSKLASEVKMKYIAQLTFHYDDSAVRFQKISTLLHKVKDEDEKRPKPPKVEDDQE
jgi:ribosome-binding factor A